ncbi:MAG: beta-propeller domain-containing protein, partial [Candidatus Thermoplasmatota archaeon]
ILLAEINKSQYPNPTPSTYGEYVWQGAYVFDLSLEGGLILKGRITHSSSFNEKYYYSSPYSVKRSLYIDKILYTISDKKIKMNSIENLAEVCEIELGGK